VKKFITVTLVCLVTSLGTYFVTNAAVGRIKKRQRITRAVPANATYGCKLSVAANGTSYNNFYSIAYSYWVPTCSVGRTQTGCVGCVLVTLFEQIDGNYSPLYSTCLNTGSLQCNTSSPNCTAQISGIRDTYGTGNYKVVWKFYSGTCDIPGSILATQSQVFKVTNL
jgi:hypothetical protein